MKVHKLGFIKGGVCAKRLKQRKGRARGAWMAWNDIKDNEEIVIVKNDWYQILKMPKYKGIGKCGNGDSEIGYLRMHQLVFPRLIEDKQKFKLETMIKWIEGMASCEFGMSMESPLSIINPDEKIYAGLMPPKKSDDNIYEKFYGVPAGLVESE